MSRPNRPGLLHMVSQGLRGKPRTRSEKLRDRWEEKAQGISSSAFVQVSRDPMAVGFLSIKDQVSKFAENCKALTPVLDALGKAHPAIAVVVALFKVGMELELTRRENDGRVRALYTTMLEMMETFQALENGMSSESEKQKLETTLKARISGDNGIENTIRACLLTCDTYYKRRLLVKVFTSGQWQEKFTDFAARFEAHKAGLQSDLGIYTVHALSNISSTMQMIFERLSSIEEQALSGFIGKHGGEDAVKRDKELMETLISMCRLHDKDNGDSALNVLDLQVQISQDAERIIEEDRSQFNSKLEMMEKKLKQSFEDATRRESNRVIKVIEAGPHERIWNPDVLEVWMENRWRGSVKATRLVLALHDHFYQRAHRQSSENSTAQSGSIEGSSDEWCIDYINVFRVQQLIEAIDDDVSSFITVDEINAFTNARPEGWTLPHWIAYSTIGVELATSWYYVRIIAILDWISVATQKALPGNRVKINEFTGSSSLWLTERLLSGFKNTENLDGIDWSYDSLFRRFKSFILEEEEELQTALQSASYKLDDENTLKLVTDGRQPEKYIFPLICLLVRKAASIIRRAQFVLLDGSDLDSIQTSLNVAMKAMEYRKDTLEASYVLQNLDPEAHIQRFFYGMCSNVLRPSQAFGNGHPVSDYCTRDESGLSFEDEEAIYESWVPGRPPGELTFAEPSEESVHRLNTPDLPFPSPFPSPFSATLVWDWAIRALIHYSKAKKSLETPYVRPRRRRREIYTSLVHQRDAYGYSISFFDEYIEETRDLFEHDLVDFWIQRAQFTRRRSIIHESTYCDSCNADKVVGARLLCVECSFHSIDSTQHIVPVDFCWECVVDHRDHQFAGERGHNAAHHLLLLRQVSTNRMVYAAIKESRDVINTVSKDLLPWSLSASVTADPCQGKADGGVSANASELYAQRDSCKDASVDVSSDIPLCSCCSKALCYPFWSCLRCAQAYICYPCNAKVETQQPWLYEHRARPPGYKDPEGLHAWDHSLVLITRPTASDETIATLDTRIDGLEKTLNDHFGTALTAQSALGDVQQMQRSQTMEIAELKSQLDRANQRMEKMEGLLQRLVDRSGMPSNS